jgi:hypothetical protein
MFRIEKKGGLKLTRSRYARRRAAASRGLLVSSNNNNNLDLPEQSNNSNLTEWLHRFVRAGSGLFWKIKWIKGRRVPSALPVKKVILACTCTDIFLDKS